MSGCPSSRALGLAITVAAISAAFVSTAAGQFATAITRPAALGPVPNPNPALVYKLDLATGVSTQFFDPLAAPVIPATAPGFQGLAADEANRRLYAVTTNGLRSDLHAISYDTALATFVAQCRINPLIDNTVSNANGVVLTGLGYDSTRNRLFGVKSLQSGSGATLQPEGIYEINTTTGQTTLVRTFEVSPASDFTIDGFDYDAASDKFFMADDDDTGGRNVYSLDASNLAAPLVIVFTYPAGTTDVDGLAVGGGKVFLLSDGVQGNGGTHKIYDIASGTFDAPITTPYPSYAPSSIGPVNPSGGATYAPGLFTAPPTLRCNAADIAFDDGLALPPIGIAGGTNNGVTEGDYNLFFANFFDALPVCDIANDDSSPLPPFGTLQTNNGVTEGDYNLFFSIFFNGCAF
ncbi:MAG: hypothetical protein K2X32_12470 [Phycisphaerales bacterium]|nr:hypothetical protein [Phycisphaerales bacterium]